MRLLHVLNSPLMVTCDLLRVSYQTLSLQYVVMETMRDLEIGQVTQEDISNEVTVRISGLGVSNPSQAKVSLCLIENYPSACSGLGSLQTGDMFVFSVEHGVDSFVMRGLNLLSVRPFVISAQAIGRLEHD